MLNAARQGAWPATLMWRRPVSVLLLALGLLAGTPLLEVEAVSSAERAFLTGCNGTVSVNTPYHTFCVYTFKANGPSNALGRCGARQRGITLLRPTAPSRRN